MRTVIIVLVVFLCPAYATESGDTAFENQPGIESKAENLTGLLNSMDYISREIVSTQKLLQSPAGKGKEDLLTNKIGDLSRKLISLEKNFDYIASEVNFQGASNNIQGDFNWNEELKTLLGPLIRELQRVTLRPREIERLRSDIELFKEQLETIQNALINLDIIIKSSTHPRLREKLLDSHAMWTNRKNEIKTLKNIAITQLETKIGGEESLTQSVQKVPGIFFKSHGKHMLFAFIVLVFSAFIMFRLHGLIKKISPMHSETRSIYVRVFDLSYLFGSFAFSLIVTLGVFYFFSDWVLLSLAIVFIIGILWASKETLPRAWNQIRLILNLGPVRERELIVYNGLPYRVMNINIYTIIENPLVECGKITLPIADLLDYRSRPVMPDEPWFPSEKNDWVLLNDKVLGRVVSQTPETVKLFLVGGATVSYNTADFLSLSPMNLSSGFRLWVEFPIDFVHKDIITGELLVIIRKDILSGLREAGHGGSVSGVNAYFIKASDFSLDIEIMADFYGDAGGSYFKLERLIQKLCMDSCIKNKWTVPFLKLKVHMADNK